MQKSESELRWGVFRNLDQVKSAGLLSLLPNSRICVTGYMAAEVVKAIRVWTDIIGRTPYLKVENCFDQKASRIIRLTGPNDSACQNGMAGFTDTIDDITVCQQYPGPALNHVLLHETGHMWGLCDQYGGAVDCQWGRPNPNTIMGAVNLSRPLAAPTPDDIEGIKAVTSSDQVPANRAWAAFARQAGAEQPGPADQQATQPNPTLTSQAPKAPQSTPQPSSGQQPDQSSSGQGPNACYQFGSFQLCR